MGAEKFREVRTKLAEAAGFLYRDEDEVRDMAEALDLKEAAGLGGRVGAMHSLGIRQGRPFRGCAVTGVANRKLVRGWSTVPLALGMSADVFVVVTKIVPCASIRLMLRKLCNPA